MHPAYALLRIVILTKEILQLQRSLFSFSIYDTLLLVKHEAPISVLRWSVHFHEKIVSYDTGNFN